VQLFQAVAHHLVTQVALELDDKAVVAEAELGRARLDLGEVQVPGGELAEDLMKVARSVGLLEANEARAVGPVGAGTTPRATSTKRVWLPAWSSTACAIVSNP